MRESKASGYLAGEPLTEAQQTDLMQFSLDGSAAFATESGYSFAGSCDIRNVSANGGGDYGQCVITDECMRGVFTNCSFIDSLHHWRTCEFRWRSDMGDAAPQNIDLR